MQKLRNFLYREIKGFNTSEFETSIAKLKKGDELNEQRFSVIYSKK